MFKRDLVLWQLRRAPDVLLLCFSFVYIHAVVLRTFNMTFVVFSNIPPYCAVLARQRFGKLGALFVILFICL